MRQPYPGSLAQWQEKGGNANGYVETAISTVNELWFVSDEPGYRQGILARISPGQRAVWSTLQCCGEVQNGGFSQLFYNSNGEMTHDAIAGFRLFGARDYETLFVEACAVFPGGRVPTDRLARWATLDPMFAREADTFNEQLGQEEMHRRMEAVYQRILAKHNHVWDDLESALYKLIGNDYSNSNLEKMLGAYVDSHPAEFFAIDGE
jgi:hypothetical protein